MIETLADLFAVLGPKLGVDPDTLAVYALEDQNTGYHTAAADWPIGSIWAVEGYVLYALARALKPDQVLEIGTHYGCSATHILTALADNKRGLLESIDIWEGAGSAIPDALRWRWRLTAADALTYLPIAPADLRPAIVFEDGPHDYEFTLRMISQAVMLGAKVIISHDACHPIVGGEVSRAWDAMFGEGQYIKALIPPSDCGLAIWVKGD